LKVRIFTTALALRYARTCVVNVIIGSLLLNSKDESVNELYLLQVFSVCTLLTAKLKLHKFLVQLRKFLVQLCKNVEQVSCKYVIGIR